MQKAISRCKIKRLKKVLNNFYFLKICEKDSVIYVIVRPVNFIEIFYSITLEGLRILEQQEMLTRREWYEFHV
jgi:hypothetical protein